MPQTDSSLLDEWEALTDPAAALARLGDELTHHAPPPPPRPLSQQGRPFDVMVRNAMFRRVELVASGEADAMATFLAWCQHGPSHAHVERVETTDADDSEALTGFQIKLTH